MSMAEQAGCYLRSGNTQKTHDKDNATMNSNAIPIFYACDDNFVKHTIVSLTSMIENADPTRKYRVHVLHTNISERMMEKARHLSNDRFEITFENVSGYLEKIQDKLPIRHYYTKTTYFRLFIADMFPEYDKAIYIDSDTVVTGDISKLYDTDIDGFYIGACVEQAMAQMNVYGTYAEKVVGIDRRVFFNAGMMLINCDTWRKVGLLDEFIKLLGIYNFVVTQDEDYLNVICKWHVKLLDQRWNTELTEGIVYDYDVSEANVLHYIMTNKPWHYADCRGADIYWSYAKKTEMYDEIKAELDSYTDEQREKDRASGENLCQMAINETNKEDNFLKKMMSKCAPDRVKILERIDEYERSGRFDEDVEDDPPSRMLMPDEIDYVKRTAIQRIKTRLAYGAARRFVHRLIREKKLIIKEIKGIENLKKLDTGAVITCNHFNAFDSFAVQVAYEVAKQKGRKLWRVIREGNYTSFPGFYGRLMRNCNTLPLSSNPKTMRKFMDGVRTHLDEGDFVLIYPEQSMWWNYRKPKPLKEGAYYFASKSNVPVLPMFITMQDSCIIGEDGFPTQEYTIHVCEPIYPDSSVQHKENVRKMMEENSRVWREVYEKEYGIPLIYK